MIEVDFKVEKKVVVVVWLENNIVNCWEYIGNYVVDFV